jgi:hypothetical protein
LVISNIIEKFLPSSVVLTPISARNLPLLRDVVFGMMLTLSVLWKWWDAIDKLEDVRPKSLRQAYLRRRHVRLEILEQVCHIQNMGRVPFPSALPLVWLAEAKPIGRCRPGRGVRDSGAVEIDVVGEIQD